MEQRQNGKQLRDSSSSPGVCDGLRRARTFRPSPTRTGARRMHFRLPITHDLSAPFDFLYEGSGIAASIEAAELITGRPLMWITTQFLPNTRPGTVVDLDVVTPVAGRATSIAMWSERPLPADSSQPGLRCRHLAAWNLHRTRSTTRRYQPRQFTAGRADRHHPNDPSRPLILRSRS